MVWDESDGRVKESSQQVLSICGNSKTVGKAFQVKLVERIPRVCKALIKTEEELRHSMPNLAPRTSLRSLEAVRNSRSMEANLQSSGNRISDLPHAPSSGMSSSRMRGSGQSPLSMRVPVKAMGSMPGAHQPSRGLPVVQSVPNGGVQRIQSPGPANGGAYPAGRASTGGGRQAAAPSSRGRLAQTPRRSMGMTRMNGPISNESWRDGCY